MAYVDGIINYGGVGAFPTPMVTGAMDPVGAYVQNQAQAAGTEYFPPAPSMSQSLMGFMPGGMGGQGSGGFLNGMGGGNGIGLGFNIPTFQLALGGLQTIGSLWQAWEANKLAKKQFNAMKEFANANLANQIQSYNTTLEDRARSRYHTEGGTQEDAQAYIDKHRLRERQI